MRTTLTFLIFLLTIPLVFGQVSFDAPRSIQLPSQQYAVAVADLNRDGRPDLISGGASIGDAPGKIYVSINTGSGNFQTPQEYQVGTRTDYASARTVRTIAAADMNNDGNVDVIIGHPALNNDLSGYGLMLTILHGNGQGQLQPAEALPFFTNDQPTFLTDVSLADLNNDGLKDVLLGCRWDGLTLGRVYTVRNLGGGNYQVRGPRVLYAGEGMAVGNFNGDGNVDAAFSSVEGITLLNGDGNYNLVGGDWVLGREQLNELVVTDFNNDKRDDLAVTDYNPSRRIRILIYRRSSWPRFPVTVFRLDTNIYPDVLRAADINGDAKADIIAVDGRTGGVEMFLGAGDGNFQPLNALIANTPASDIAFADFDGNQMLDFVTANPTGSSSTQAQVFLQRAPSAAKLAR